MSALTIEQFQKQQTHYSGYLHSSPVIKFDTVTRRIKPITEKVILKRNEARIRPQESITLQSIKGTLIKKDCAQQEAVGFIQVYSTQGTGVLDFWLGEPNLSDYERLLDDYDVSAVEEIHMQCASTYGW